MKTDYLDELINEMTAQMEEIEAEKKWKRSMRARPLSNKEIAELLMGAREREGGKREG